MTQPRLDPGKTILVVDDDLKMRSYLEMALRRQGYSVRLAEDGEQALQLLESASGVFLDIIMPGKDGLETLREIRGENARIPVIMMSAAPSPGHVMEAMRLGANDFLAKPIHHVDLDAAIEKWLTPLDSTPTPKRAATQPERDKIFVSSNSRMALIQKRLRQIAKSEVPVLLRGETGTGKEVLARQLHAFSNRAGKPFLKLNCAALPAELVESELFGYERGAFTGAYKNKIGKFEAADGGTIFLDEIGDMPFPLQAKLLQVLQDQEFQRLGSHATIRVDVRIIAATHSDLETSMRAGQFREDLFYRLNVITLQIPALRERRSEIVPIAEFFLTKHAEPGTLAPGLPPALRGALLEHTWPGNIRELENLMRMYLVLGETELVVEELHARARRAAPSLVSEIAGPARNEAAASVFEAADEARRQAEKDAILATLEATRWNRKKAAALLNIDYKALLYKMKKLELENRPVAMAAKAS